ncbi:hypothetical protein GGF43_005489 [Coemansia sp. RSA 2618]|nr:hypothetical protein GGF43_005489 [Coemansia sp. RSA 2618]
MGFRKELDQLIPALPKDRKTLLVSATLGRSVQSLASTVFSGGFDLLDCVGQEETNTHANVKQEYIPVPFSQQLPVLVDLIEEHAAKNNAEKRGTKIVVFLPTIKATTMYAHAVKTLLAVRGGRNGFVDVVELHGGIQQSSRSRRSDRFRSATLRAGNTSILVTTDVSARGVDYPDVSMVIQVGIPSATEAYIHRLGRTGRAGKTGEGVIMLSPVEMPFLREISDVPVALSETYTPEHIANVCDFQNGPLKHLAPRWENLTAGTDPEQLNTMYTSLLAFYAAHSAMIGRPRLQNIVDVAEDFFVPFNLPAPELSAKMREVLGMNGKAGGFGNRRDRGGQRFGGQGFGGRGGGGFGNRGDNGFGSRGGGGGFGGRGSGGFGNRGDRGDRSFGDRGDRSSGSRSFGDRGDRSFGNRGDRSFGNRGDRSFGDRGDRSSGNRSFGNRESRGFGDRGSSRSGDF